MLQTPVKRHLWASCGLLCQTVDWGNKADQIQERDISYFHALLPLIPKHQNTVCFSNLLNPIKVKQLIFTCSAWAARMPALFTPSTSVTVWEELNKHTHSRMHLITHYLPWDKAVTSAGGKLSNETHSANRYKTHTQWHAGQLQKSYQ